MFVAVLVAGGVRAAEASELQCRHHIGHVGALFLRCVVGCAISASEG